MFWRPVLYFCLLPGVFCSTDATVNACVTNAVNSSSFDNDNLGLGGKVVEEESATTEVTEDITESSSNWPSSSENPSSEPQETASTTDNSESSYMTSSLANNEITPTTESTTLEASSSDLPSSVTAPYSEYSESNTDSENVNSSETPDGTSELTTSSVDISSLFPYIPSSTLTLIQTTTSSTPCANALCSLQDRLQELTAKIIAFLKDFLQKFFGDFLNIR